MHVDIAEAGPRLDELLQSVESGNIIVITRDGKPVAEIKRTPRSTDEWPPPKFDTMKGKIHLKPGWDDPITEEQFLSGDF